MSGAFYNEHDPKAAAWLEELIAAGDLPPGHVDDRDVQLLGAADHLERYDQCHFFAGIGGWPLALDLAGWPRDRPIWSASLPCQPFSDAGKSLGVDDDRHLFPVFHGLVEHYRPERIVGEQVASKAGKTWFAAVQADLEALGYWCGAIDICAAGIGAPHIRQRLWWCAIRKGLDDPAGARRDGGVGCGEGGLGDADEHGPQGRLQRREDSQRQAECGSVGRDGAVGGVADDHGAERQARGPITRGVFARADTGESGAARGSALGGVADSNGRGREEHAEENLDQREPDGRSPERNDSLRCGSAGGVVDDQRDRLHGSREAGEGRGTEPSGGCERDPWSDVIYVPCADGKSRPLPRLAQPGTEPLADGVSDGMVRGGDPSFPPLVTQATEDMNDTNEARTMRLKGYGNAICAPLAAEFIGAVMEITG